MIEVGRWERTGIRASVQETSLTMRLTIESRVDGGSPVCDTGKAEITDRFVSELGIARAAAAP